jgi:uncharacterized alkaline shock family protein YloU
VTAASSSADADAIVAATLACPYVAGMSGGVMGEVATYLPGRRVRGVRSSSEGVDVHVVGVFGPSIAEIDAQVRAAVTPLVHGAALTVHVDDLAVPASTDATAVDPLTMEGPRNA